MAVFGQRSETALKLGLLRCGNGQIGIIKAIPKLSDQGETFLRRQAINMGVRHDTNLQSISERVVDRAMRVNILPLDQTTSHKDAEMRYIMKTRFFHMHQEDVVSRNTADFLTTLVAEPR
jgi:hypothetical protein